VSELTDKDFEIEYKGYVINSKTTADEIKNNLGIPEDFENNNDGYITTVESEWRWQLRYPNYAEQSDIRVIFYTDLDTDMTTIKTVVLETVETCRGVKVGDNINKIYELYGFPVEEKRYDSNIDFLEMNYIKGNEKLSFVIEEESGFVKYIYIYFNIVE